MLLPFFLSVCPFIAQENPADTCPTGYAPAAAGRTEAPDDNTAVQYSALRDLGWEVPAIRPSRDTFTTAYTRDFWSVMCNSHNNVDNSRRYCLENDNVNITNFNRDDGET